MKTELNKTNRAPSIKPFMLSSPWYALVGMFVAQLISSTSNLSVAPLSPFFQESYGVSLVQIGFLTSVLSIGASTFAIPGGFIVDKFGIKKTLIFFGSLLAVCYSFLGLIHSYLLSLFLMLLIGVACGTITSITTKGVVDWFSFNKRGFAMSFKQTGVVGGGALASFLIVYFSSKLGWQFTVIALGVCFFLIFLIVALLYKDPTVTKETGASAAVSLFWNNVLALFNNRVFLFLSLIMSLFLWCQFALMTYLLLFLRDALHYSLYLSGIGLSVFLIGGVIGRLFWGWISDVFFSHARELVIIMNALIGLASLVVLIVLGLNGAVVPVFVIFLTLFISGINTAGWNGVMITILVSEVDNDKAGLASGMSYAIGSLGTMVGVPITGLIIEHSSYFIALGFLSILFFLAAFFVHFVMQMKQKLATR